MASLVLWFVTRRSQQALADKRGHIIQAGHTGANATLHVFDASMQAAVRGIGCFRLP